MYRVEFHLTDGKTICGDVNDHMVEEFELGFYGWVNDVKNLLTDRFICLGCAESDASVDIYKYAYIPRDSISYLLVKEKCSND